MHDYVEVKDKKSETSIDQSPTTGHSSNYEQSTPQSNDDIYSEIEPQVKYENCFVQENDNNTQKNDDDIDNV